MSLSKDHRSPLDERWGNSLPMVLDDPRGYIPVFITAEIANIIANEAFAICEELLGDDGALNLGKRKAAELRERVAAIGFHLGDGVAFDVLPDLAAGAAFCWT